MRVAILESIIMPAGHEVEFDRILVDELKRQGYVPCFFVPKNFTFKIDYKTDVEYLTGGEVVTYAGSSKLKKIWLSVLREKRRVEWFNSAYEKACQGMCDVIIIPTATYRYLRTICNSKLKNSPVPVVLIFHGINPKEKANFVKQAKKCEKYKNIYLKVITLRNDFKQENLANLALIEPPVFKPMDLNVNKNLVLHNPIKVGFFGQFRKEKNLGFFLQAFENANFTKSVKLIVQGATTTPRIPTVTGTFNSTSPSEFFITIFETLPFFTISLMDSTTLFAPEEVPVLLLSIFSSMLMIASTTLPSAASRASFASL